MQLIPLGKTELKVTPICFGGWQASGWYNTDDKKFTAALHRAIDLGINFIDTAEIYGEGQSELLIGSALGKVRNEIVLASKLSHRNAAPAQARKALENSLRRLKTDYIDLYQYHWPSKTVALSETIEALLQFKQEGKIRAIGVSNWMEPEWKEYYAPQLIDSLQCCFNLLWRSVEKNVLTLCKKERIAVLCYSPLAQGILADRFNELSDVPPDYRKHNVLLTPEKFPKIKEFLSELRKLANLYGKSMSQTALRWLLQNEVVTSVIVGCSSTLQVEENIGALGWNLKPEHITQLSELSAPFSTELKPHDTLFGWHSRAS